MFKRIALAAVAAVLPLSFAPHASAYSPSPAPTGVVTKAEFDAAGKGERLREVQRAWGATGQVALRGPYTVRWYVTNASPTVALVTYTRGADGHWRVVETHWVDFTQVAP